jgi:D-inositol-3-phosphate glycosyltransferase
MAVQVQSETGSEAQKGTREDRPEAGAIADAGPQTRTALLTGGIDRPYAFGLAMSLVEKGVRLEVIGSDAVDSPEMHSTPNLTFLNLQGDKRGDVSVLRKVTRVFAYYRRLLRFAASTDSKVFHILWNNKLQFFDRSLLMLYYKLLGKKVVFTAHNVNAGKRDGNDTWHNRLGLTLQYRLADHIFVHTAKMKTELVEEFGARQAAVTVIRFPLNSAFPDTQLTSEEARARIGIGENDKAILFYGAIRPYKGLEYLVDAFHQLVAADPTYRLIIAAEPKKGSEKYLEDILETIERAGYKDRVLQRLQFIPDDETEIYYKAADVLALPYKEIFQSGVLFVGYSFGLPVVAADVGSFREDIIEGSTGFVCPPNDPAELAKALDRYFRSDLYKDLKRQRKEIRDFANALYSWNMSGQTTVEVYHKLLNSSPS